MSAVKPNQPASVIPPRAPPGTAGIVASFAANTRPLVWLITDEDDTSTAAAVRRALTADFDLLTATGDVDGQEASLVLFAGASRGDLGRLRAFAAQSRSDNGVPYLALVARDAVDRFDAPAAFDVIGVPFADVELHSRVRSSIELARLRRDADVARRSEARDGFLVALDDAVRPLVDPDQIVAVSARMLGGHLDVDRCAYAEIEADQDTMNLTGNYRRHEGVKSIVGRLTFTAFGGEVLALMRANEPYVVNDVDTHEPSVGDPAAYRATQIQAVICVPLHKAGHFVAAMAVHMMTPRRWTRDEVELLGTVANRCWEAIERARITRDLIVTERRLGLAQRAAGIGVFDWLIVEDRVIWTPELEALYGMAAGTFGGHFDEWLARVLPGDAARVEATIRDAIAARQSSTVYEFRARVGQRADDERLPVRWFAGQASFVYDDATGQPLRMIGVNIDVDDRKRSQDELEDARRRLEATLGAVEVGSFSYDPISDQSSVDRNLAEMFGFEPGKPASDFADRFHERIHPEDRARHVAAMHDAITGDADIFRSEFRVVRPDDTVRWLSVRGVIERDPATRQPTRTNGVTLDVTERRVAEEALRASEARFRQLADSIPMLTWTAGPDGAIDWFNQRWTEYTGLGVDLLLTAEARDAIHHPDFLQRVRETWQRSIRSGQPFDMEFPLRAADGSYRMFLARGEPVRDASGRIIQWIGTSTDIEQKRQLIEAERGARAEAERVGRMKDEFLATLSHELRTPLNAILGWAQLLLRGTLKENEARSAIATIERNARAQTQMIEDLLDMSRIVSGKVRLDVQRADLAEIVVAAMHAVEPSAAGRKVRLERILDPHAGPVSGDPARLQQVVWNLLVNAIKFTPAGGKVQVVLERVNSHLELSVADTGIGIQPEFLPFVFDRFRQADASSTRQFGGLGLGLSIVRQLVELHGGTVRAKSPGDGRGATFIVALPVMVTHELAIGRDHPSTPAPGPTVEDRVPALTGLTVLVVDDEPDARALVKRLLEDREARVVTAPDAAEALRILQSEPIDVLLSDVGMPNVDGYELIRRVRALGAFRNGNVPAVALTAFARTDDRRRALLAGFQSHVSKPTEAAELIAVVASVTGRTGIAKDEG